MVTLAAGKSLDFETTEIYTIAVTASAPASSAQPFTQKVRIDVLNVLENRINFASQTLSILENSAAGTSAGTLSASSTDGGTVTFTAAHPVFSVSGTGGVTLKSGWSLNYETTTYYQLKITAKAKDASNFVRNVIVEVVNIDQEGNAEAPYEIDTLAELQSIATGFRNESFSSFLGLEDSLSVYYVLTADIDATPTAAWNDKGTDTSVYEGFLPIGRGGARFTGGFDGAGFVISGLNVARSSADGVGLFGRTGSAAVLRNIALEGGSVSGNDGVGGLVGNNSGAVQASYATGSVSGGSSVGGLVGESDGAVYGSYATGSVSGNDGVGGLVGNNSGTVQASYAIGSVSGLGFGGGGLVGWSSGTVQDSFAVGSVNGNEYIGGLVGWSSGTVQDSFAVGLVSGNAYVGGLIGENDGAVQDSFVAGDASGGAYVGGLTGLNSDTIQNSYAIGLVSGNAYVGGLVGSNVGVVTVERAYCVDGTIADRSGVDDGEADCVGSGDGDGAFNVTLDTLEAQTCAASTVFRWDDPGDDPDGGLLDCATAGEANFPWDFGDSDELPVLNGVVGDVLDVAGQRALIAFDASDAVPSTLPGESITFNAGGLVIASTGNTLEYLWSIPPEITDAVFASDGSSVTFTVLSGAQEVGLVIIERDADGNIVRIYSDTVAIVPRNGTAEAPYQIGTLAELQSIATGFQSDSLLVSLSLSESLAAHYVLAADIDAAPTASGTWQLDDKATVDTSDDEHGFLPIGNCGTDDCGNYNDEPFTGSFDGAGFVIRGLYIDRPSTKGVGLFAIADSATLRNVALEGGSVRGNAYVGGLVGWSEGGVVQASFAVGDVSGNNDIGGLVGVSQGTVQASFAAGSVRGGDYNLGGLVGRSEYGMVQASFATGSVSGDDYSYNAGGLVGFNTAGGSVQASFATGSVRGYYSAGGLVGFNWDGVVQTSFATGNVIGNYSVGGLVGWNADTVQDGYAFGKAILPGCSESECSVGGVIGFLDPAGTVQNVYFNSDGQSGLEAVGIASSEVALAGGLTEGGIRGLTCATALFQDSNGEECSTTWDFGSDDQLPVIAGEVGGLDVVGQRDLLAFDADSLVQSAVAGDSVTIDASELFTGGENTVEYFWSIWPDVADAVFSTDGSSVAFTVSNEGPEVRLTIIERDADGDLAGVYSDAVIFVPQNGTAEAPYLIDSLAELQSIATGFRNEGLAVPLTVTDSLAAHYVLAANIDASPTATWNHKGTDTSIYEGFLPIGHCGSDNVCDPSSTSDDEPFTGGFDGNGYVISDLHIDRPTIRGVGLFASADSTAVLRNVAMEGGSVSGDYNVGGLVGHNAGGTIESSYASGSVTGTHDYVGGLVGYNDGGTIESSHASGSVNGDDRVGGLVGSSSGTIQNSHASGEVEGGYYHVGGLVGYNDGTIESSYASGSVNGIHNYVGGLVGSNDGTIESSHASGEVEGGNDHVGGLVGYNAGGAIQNSYASSEVVGGRRHVGGLVGSNDGGTVLDSFATGSVSDLGEYSDSVGGLVGYNDGAIESSYATGDVAGSNDLGGLVGSNDDGGTIESSYASGSVSGENRVGGLVGSSSGAIQNSHASGEVESGYDHVGGLVGHNEGGTIESSYASGSVTGTRDHVGGLVGYNEGGAIQNSHASSEVEGGNDHVGGLVGYNDDGGTIESSYAIGSVSGSRNNIGGLVGSNIGTIESSHAIGSVSDTSHDTGSGIGGLVGNNGGTVRASYATGSVSSTGHSVGGLVGSNGGTVQGSFAIGSVSGDYNVGGLVGSNGRTVQGSFAIGSVSGESEVGGLVGFNSRTVEDGFAIGSISGERNVGGLIGWNIGTGDQRAYCVVASGGEGCVGIGGSGTDTFEVTLADLEALTCSTAVFEDSNGDNCATAGAANFPWDFGSSSELPVINGIVGGLDADGQRALIE